MSEIYELRRGSSALILSIPHAGRELTPGLESRLSPIGRQLIDTDWWLERLYGFAAEEFDATIIRAKLSRYVIDLNRDPSGASLYPGQATTDLVPVLTFDGEPIYLPGQAPTADEIELRKGLYFAPYHARLAAELERVKAAHGKALLYDCHSIRSIIPRLFPGTLPDFNLGTNSGASCDPAIEQRISAILASHGAFTHVVNGRFKGGWITRFYGRPADNVHAVQMELACSAYMSEAPPFTYDEAKAAKVEPVFRRIFETMIGWANGDRS